jgi:nitrite reductase/ring-hydroxylating ferredoxin subunit
MPRFDPWQWVQPEQVHRDLYTSEDIFALEMQRLWQRSWLFVGHDSQIPQAGDFITTVLAGQPVLMVRADDGRISVLHNRCAHKGAALSSLPQGNTGRLLRCAYHGWTYRPDGGLLGVPLRAGYEHSDFQNSSARQGLTPFGEVAIHQGFVFARGQSNGRSFEEDMGELLTTLDLLVQRSPLGRLRVAGGVLKTEFGANWKIYLENINDAFHPVTTHASVVQAASDTWGQPLDGTPVPLSMKQLLPFGASYSFFEQMGARLLPGGHSILGTQQSLHTSYSELGSYAQDLEAAHGHERAHAVLAFAPQNVVFYPSMSLKGMPQVMRVLRPLSAGRTVLEAWAFEAEGAPATLLENALLYNRQVFSPMSMVAHDDLHLFEGIQRSLSCAGHSWISLHRGGDTRVHSEARDVSGIDEGLMRNQYHAWAQLMQDEPAGRPA